MGRGSVLEIPVHVSVRREAQAWAWVLIAKWPHSGGYVACFFLSGEFPVMPEEQGLFWSPSLSFQQLSWLYYYQYIPNIPCYTQYSPHLFAHYLTVPSSFTFIHDLEKAFPSFFRQNTHRCPWELCPKVAVSASTLDINYMTVLLKYNYFIPVPNCKHVNFFFHLWTS